MCRIVVAPDKFKGTLTACEAASVMARVATDVFPGFKIDVIPMADGGEGTAALIGRMRGYAVSHVDAFDALMRPVKSEVWISSDGKSAVIDSSACIGLGLIEPELRNPWQSTSYGLGVAVRNLFGSGVDKVEIGIGGTATVDSGIGFLQALGAEVMTVDGRLTQPVTASMLNSIVAVDLAPVECFSQRVSGISDVDVPLYDTDGYPSMLMFAPQKGVEQDHLVVLSMALRHLIEHVRWSPSAPDFEAHFGGAGGGLGFAIGGALGAPVKAGADTLVDELGIFTPRPALVVTGEGCFDAQSLTGKLTGTILGRCREEKIACRVIAGCVGDGIGLPEVVDSSLMEPQGELTPEVAARRLEAATTVALETFRDSIV